MLKIQYLYNFDVTTKKQQGIGWQHRAVMNEHLEHIHNLSHRQNTFKILQMLAIRLFIASLKALVQPCYIHSSYCSYLWAHHIQPVQMWEGWWHKEYDDSGNFEGIYSATKYSKYLVRQV